MRTQPPGTPLPARHGSKAVTQQAASTAKEEVKTSVGSAPGKDSQQRQEETWAGSSLGAPHSWGGGLPHSVPAQPAGKTPLPTVSPSIAGASSCGSRAVFSNGQKKMLQPWAACRARGTSRQLEVIQPLARTHLETGAEGTSLLAAPYLLPLHPPHVSTSWLHFHCFSGKGFLKPLFLKSFFFT